MWFGGPHRFLFFVTNLPCWSLQCGAQKARNSFQCPNPPAPLLFLPVHSPHCRFLSTPLFICHPLFSSSLEPPRHQLNPIFLYQPLSSPSTQPLHHQIRSSFPLHQNLQPTLPYWKRKKPKRRRRRRKKMKRRIGEDEEGRRRKIEETKKKDEDEEGKDSCLI